MKKTNILNRLVWLFLVGLTLFLTTCGDKNPTGGDENTPEPINPNTASLDIGPDGGSVTSKDGLVTLTFPQGALAGTETITITPIEQDDLGPEFDEVIDEFGFGKAYEMGPDGLSFEKPVEVTFQSDQVVTQQGDSVSISPELLFTNEGGGVAALDSLRMSVDEETGKTTITGELHHFSPVLVMEDKINNIRFLVNGVPEYLNINVKIYIIVALSQIIKDTHKPLKNVKTRDLSSKPLQTLDPSERKWHEGQMSGIYEYSCIDTGTGIYKSEASGLIEKNDDGIIYPVLIDGLIVQKNVQCVAPPQLISPANGATDVELNVFLEWSDDRADYYLVQVAEEGQEFTDPNSIEIKVNKDDPSTITNKLKPGTTYRWRVRAIFEDSSDDGVFNSEWSEIWSFTTVGGASLGFGSRTECLTFYEGDWFFVLGWSVDLSGIHSDEYGNVVVYLNVELPESGESEVVKSTGSDSQVSYPLYSPTLLYMAHIIKGTGEYKFDVDKVVYNGDEIDFSGETTSGVLLVTEDDLKGEGDC